MNLFSDETNYFLELGTSDSVGGTKPAFALLSLLFVDIAANH